MLRAVALGEEVVDRLDRRARRAPRAIAPNDALGPGS